MKIKCTNVKCLYEWNYLGKQKFYCTCPRCLNKVNIKKNKQKQGVENDKENNKILL